MKPGIEIELNMMTANLDLVMLKLYRHSMPYGIYKCRRYNKQS